MPDYETGYKKPPKATRFKAGQSGNPKGRPKRYQSLKADLIDELQETISITENGKTRKMSKQRVMIKQLSSKTLGGDQPSLRVLVNLIQKHLPSLPDEIEQTPDILPQEDEDLLAFYAKTRGDI